MTFLFIASLILLILVSFNHTFLHQWRQDELDLFRKNKREFLFHYLIIAPIFEEIVFRLLMMSFMLNVINLGLILTVLVSSLSWASFHAYSVTIPRMEKMMLVFVLFLAGFVLGMVFTHSGALPVIILHFITNAWESFLFWRMDKRTTS